MKNSSTPAAAFADTKPHYHILDGLRGIAALIVVFYHIFESFATSHLDQNINHGYLAVDFFFILSGFVIGYAYDDRQPPLSKTQFIRRRLIRLHPMVVMGALIGALVFYTQGCEAWDVSKVTIGALLVAMLLNMLLFPVWKGFEVRGIGEMYPLNGPSWSLFFEYIGNLLYIFFIRKLSTPLLACLVFIMGCILATYSITNVQGDLAVGWSFSDGGFWGGSLRLLFSFPAGLLLSRLFKKRPVRGAFWWGTILIAAVTVVPRIGGSTHLWANGIYDAFALIVIFPLIVWLGASGETTDRLSTRICNFLGDISYPLYIVHYPFLYLYYAWVKNNHLTFVQSLPGAAAFVIGSVVLAYLCLHFYDIPVRKWLTNRLKSKR
ncbi:acyltransferase [Hoylesella saccharolytica]|uniref:acyltransferase family protein n=1 Tax=Hoylesella saccharolytica TaxID=633701 RepID=UPI0028D4C9A3|nr:acyltransferase [Hoylesella saccharolytica]